MPSVFGDKKCLRHCPYPQLQAGVGGDLATNINNSNKSSVPTIRKF